MSRVRDLASILTASSDIATDAEVTSSIASHAAAADPHAGYLKESDFNAAGKNAIINGGMDIWQRGTSFTFGSSSVGNYSLDRWVAFRGSIYNYTRQATNDTTNLPFLQYCLRAQRPLGEPSTSNTTIGQAVETASSIPYAGKIVTLSFYARAGANYSPTSSLLKAIVQSGTGTDQPPISAFTGSNNFINQDVTLTTTWQRFTITSSIVVPGSATQLQVIFQMTPTGTAGAADYFEITGVQLEVGSSATPFSRAGGTIQGELAACERYYQKTFKQATAPANNTGDVDGEIIIGRQATSGSFEPQVWVSLRSVMRTAPVVTLYNIYSGTAGQWSDGSTTGANARAFNIGDRGFTIDNTDTALSAFNMVIHYAATAEL